MANHLLLLAFVLYAVPAGKWLMFLVTRREVHVRGIVPLQWTGFVVHLLAYGLECTATRALIVTSPRGMLSLLALCVVGVQLVVARRHGLPILGAFVLPLGAVATGAAYTLPSRIADGAPLTGALFPL